MNPFAAVDWPNLAAFILAEVAIVLLLAPVFIQRKNENRAVEVFKTKLLPLMPPVPTAGEVAGAVHPYLPDLTALRRDMAADLDAFGQKLVAALPSAPSVEEQERARAELGAAVGQAVQVAVAEAVKGRMGALSAQAGDARMTKALQESTLKARVGEKYGLKGLGALRLLQAADKDLYQLGLDAVAFAPASLDEWLEQHGDKFSMGGAAAKPKSTLVRV